MDNFKNDTGEEPQSKNPRKRSIFNIIVLVFILGIAHLLDAYASNAGNYVASSIVNELLVEKLGMSVDGTITQQVWTNIHY